MTKNRAFRSLPSPPVARRVSHTNRQFNQTRQDPYHWLRAENWQEVLKDPGTLPDDIRSYIAAENVYYENAVEGLKPLRETLFKEMRGRIKEDDSSPPSVDGPYAYFTRYREGGEYPIFVRHKVGGGPDEILFDGDKEGAGEDFFDIEDVVHSPDHAYIAYGVDKVGSEYFDIRVRHVSSGDEFSETVANTDGSVVWRADAKAYYYVERDENQRPKRVMLHVLGDDQASDLEIYEEPDDAYFLGIGESQSRAFLFISSSNGTSSEVRVLEHGVDRAPRLVRSREEDLIYSVEHHDDHFYIHTNADGAVDFKIVKAPIADPSPENWVDWLPAREGVFIRTFIPYRNFSVRLESVNALPRIIIRNWQDGREQDIVLNEAAFSLGLWAGFEFDTNIVRFTYESPTTPPEIYDYEVTTGARQLIKRLDIPSGHDPSNYIVERLSIQASDGADIPVTLLRRADTPSDVPAPLFLYGYGSYGISIPASFNSKVLSLVDRGVLYAIAHIRGGADKGRQWYLDGKLSKKTKTFDDFTSVAEALQNRGMTTPGQTVIFGGSAGGLLVGASVNRRPDLFGGVIGAVPFVDVLNTISDSELPLTPPEWVEWGNPVVDQAAYEDIKSYSPYDNICGDLAYPPILATGGIADYRVTYWEPAKWVARLRAEATGGPFFLRMDMDAGHGGAAARFKRLEEYAEYYAFALAVFGRAPDC